MTLQASGAIAISDINVELGRASTYNSNLNESALRTLAGVPSGAISLSSFYGKSNFSGIWSGSSNTTVESLNTSGTTYRIWDATYGYGAWLYTSAPNLGAGSSGNTMGHYFVSTSGTLQTKFSSFTPVGFVYFDVANKFTGTSRDGALYQGYLETSGGLIRYRHDSGGTGDWVSIY